LEQSSAEAILRAADVGGVFQNIAPLHLDEFGLDVLVLALCERVEPVAAKFGKNNWLIELLFHFAEQIAEARAAVGDHSQDVDVRRELRGILEALGFADAHDDRMT